MGLWLIALVCIPPAFLLGWLSRLSVLGSSRAREFSADAAAATLCGRPSALASALLKLDVEQEWAPRSDLRQVAVLCIVGEGRSWLGRPFSTHPPTAARVKRLQALERELQRP
jgi:heat shock protein HtpX